MAFAELSHVRRYHGIEFPGELIFLGTGTSVGVPMIGCACPVCKSPDAKNQRTRCSIVLGLPGGNLLVDTTPDLRQQLLREQIGIVHSVLFTHEHADHLMGLDDVRLFPLYLDHRLPLYCNTEVERRIRKSFDYAFEGEETHAGSLPKIDIKPISSEPFELLGAHIVPIPLLHGRFNVFGFRFGNVAYCTDTNHIPEASWPLLEGLDVLILGALRARPHPTHFNVEGATEVVQRVQPRRALFTHISHDLDHATTCAALPDGIELAYDGLRIALT